MLTLNLQALSERLLERGLTQADLSRSLEVSREAVSNWFRGESVPKPAKLLRLGMTLGLRFEQFVIVRAGPQAVVRFRKKAGRKARPADLHAAQTRGALLAKLAPRLSEQPITQPPVLANPTAEYDYIQRVAADVRRDLGIDAEKPVEFRHLIMKFKALSAVVVPVLWGAQTEHGNAMHVYLPGSLTSWVFLNLDAKATDFNFWMAHELGHSLAPTMEEDASETFADAFAQALLFPEASARAMREVLAALPAVGTRVNRIKNEARTRTISPWTIRKAVQALEKARGLPAVNLGAETAFGGAVSNFGKDFHSITETLFDAEKPNSAAFVRGCREFFRTPFFDALAAFCRAETGAEHFIHELLGLPLPDAKALAGELRG